MWSWRPSPIHSAPRRGEEHLARYARLEYGASHVGWFLTQVRKKRRIRTRVRVLYWLRNFRRGILRVGKAVKASPRPSPEIRLPNEAVASPSGSTPAPADPMPRAVSREACEHAIREYLGSGGNATYARCLACGAPLIIQGGRVWTLRRKESPPEAAEPVAPADELLLTVS